MLKFLRLIDHQPAVKFAGFQRSMREREENHQDNILEVWQSGQMRQTVNLFPIGYVRFESHNLHTIRRDSEDGATRLKSRVLRNGKAGNPSNNT